MSLSTDKFDEVLNRPEALKDSDGKYVIDCMNKEIQLIGARIDKNIDAAIDDVMTELSDYISGFNVATTHFTGKVDGQVVHVTHTFAENFVSLTRSALPFMGVSYLGASVIALLPVSPLVAGMAGVAAGLYFVVQTIKGTKKHDDLAVIRSQVAPKINIAVSELRTYIQKRFSVFNKEVIRSMKAIADDMTARMQDKVKLLKDIENNNKKKSVAVNELNGQIRMLDNIAKQVEVLGTNPFAGR